MLLLDLHEATLPHTTLLAQAIMEAVNKAKDKMPMGWKHLSRFLSPKEKEKMRKDVAQRMIDIFRNLPDEKEFEASARAGQAKKGWYAASAHSLLEVFGPDTPRFCALLASLSPKVTVQENLRNAVKFWEHWIEAGRPLTEKGIDEVGKQAIGLKWQGATNPDGTVNPGMGYKPNVLRSMTHEKPEEVVLSSGGTPTNPHVGKVDSFRANLLGDLSRVTNDVWIANFAGIDQSLFGNKAGYLAMTAKVRKVAEKMGWTPAEVQETVWSFFKALKESQTIDRKGKKALEVLTHDQVNQSEDFADLMVNDKEVRDALKKLRDRNLVGEPTPRIRDGGQDPASSPYSAATERGLAGSLSRVADRAQRLKDTEDAQEFATRGYHFPNATDIRWDRRRVTFTLSDPREIAEWKEKPRKPEDNYQMVVGKAGTKWTVVKGVVHGVPTVQDNGKTVTVSLPFREKEGRVPVNIDPEKWRAVEKKKQEKAKRAVPSLA